MDVVQRDVTNLMDIVLVPTVAGIAVPLVESRSSNVVVVSIYMLVAVPGTISKRVMYCKHPGVVVMEISIIFASTL